MSQLVETISKKPIPPHVNELLVDVEVETEDGDEVEVRKSECIKWTWH